VPKNIHQHHEGMHKGAPVSSFIKAKFMREHMTNAESILWEALKSKQLNGFKFRRQHAIGLYIVDFYCHKLKLVIEIDGGYHNTQEQREKDNLRTKELVDLGVKVIRFTNEDVEKDLDKVLETIIQSSENNN
jgi:very-short-patch-repair endonuclease